MSRYSVCVWGGSGEGGGVICRGLWKRFTVILHQWLNRGSRKLFQNPSVGLYSHSR